MTRMRSDKRLCHWMFFLMILLCLANAFGQQEDTGCATESRVGTSKEQPKFDVISVKQAEHLQMSMDWDPDGIRLIGFPFKYFVHLAYGMDLDHIYGGPKWVDSAAFTIRAKVADTDVDALRKMNLDDRKAMLKPILRDCFGLKVHCEYKEMPVYELIVAKDGAKLTAHPPESVRRGFQIRPPSDITGFDASMKVLAKLLQDNLQRTVVDKTGLSGTYDFHLKWSQNGGATQSAQSQQDAQNWMTPPENESPSIFTAVVEQLGLKLRPAKGLVKILIIDDVYLPAKE